MTDEKEQKSESLRYKLFKFFYDEHNIKLLETDIDEIQNILASTQSGWTDEDMRKAFYKGVYWASYESYHGHKFNDFLDAKIKEFLQSLPKNPSSEREAVLFAEFLFSEEWERLYAEEYRHAKTGKRMTVTELYNSPEYKLWKEGRK